MGTRAVVNFSNIWIATHWDGYPDSVGLGQTLIQCLEHEITKAKEYWKEHYNSTALLSAVDKAVWKACADHQIDFCTTTGPDDFNKIYDDYAKFEYHVSIDPVNPTYYVKYRERQGAWTDPEAVVGTWKTLTAIASPETVRKEEDDTVSQPQPQLAEDWKVTKKLLENLGIVLEV